MSPLYAKSFWQRLSNRMIVFLILFFVIIYLQLVPHDGSDRSGNGDKPEKQQYLAFGCGKVNGSYFPVLSVITDYLNSLPEFLVGNRIKIYCGSGSVSTVRDVISGRLDFGVAQSAVLYDAANGLRDWEEYGRMQNLRSVCALTTKDLTVVARVDSKVMDLADLAGKRVNIGDPGTGTNSNARQLLDFYVSKGYKPPAEILELSNEDALAAFSESKIDAIITNLSHPSQYLQDVFRCGVPARFVAVGLLQDFTKNYPYFTERVLAAAVYPEAADCKDIKVISTPTVLFTTQGASDEVVSKIVSEMVVNLQAIKRNHPELQSLEVANLLADQIVPAHKAALDAFYTAGILRARSDTTRNSLKAITFRRDEFFSERIAADFCQQVNHKRIEDLRLVLLGADNERESIYRVVSGIAYAGFACGAELYQSVTGAGIWKDMGALRNLRTLVRPYNLALLEVCPGVDQEQDLTPMIADTSDPAHIDAINLLWKKLYPHRPAVSVVPVKDAFETLSQQKGSLVVMIPVRSSYLHEDVFLWQKHWQEFQQQYRLPVLSVKPLKPSQDVCEQLPWLDSVSFNLYGESLSTAAIPVFLFASSQIPTERYLPILQAMADSWKSPKENADALHDRIRYAMGKSPLPFHAALNAFIRQFPESDPWMSRYVPESIPLPARTDLVISASNSVSGQLFCAGMLANIFSQNASVFACCTTCADESAALDDVCEENADIAVVSATSLSRRLEKSGECSHLQTIGSVYSVPLAFLAADDVISKRNPMLPDFEGSRISGPDIEFPARFRDKGITVFNLGEFRRGLTRGALINTEEIGLADAFSMYNQGTITGFFITGLHPLETLTNNIQRPGRLIPITEGYLQVLENPCYVNMTIPQKMVNYYPKITSSGDIPTIGVPMMLVASDKLPAETVNLLLKELAGNVETVRQTTPAFSEFESADLLKGTSVGTMHPGALGFYQQQGYIGSSSRQEGVQVLTMGTGSSSGSFFPIGVCLERVISGGQAKQGSQPVRIALELTDGSHQNCLAVHDQAYDLGISQADVARRAYEGKIHWATVPFDDLRVVCRLHAIPLYCLVRKNTSAKSLEELGGLSMNIGSPGSGSRLLADRVLQTLEPEVRKTILTEENDDSVALDKLKAGGLDGVFISLGVSEMVDELLGALSPYRVISLDSPAIETTAASIDGRMVTLSKRDYPALEHEIRTIAIFAVLLTNRSADEKTIENIVTTILRERSNYTPIPAGLRDMSDKDFCSDLPIPLHIGARRAFEKSGVLKTEAVSPADEQEQEQ